MLKSHDLLIRDQNRFEYVTNSQSTYEYFSPRTALPTVVNGFAGSPINLDGSVRKETGQIANYD